MRGHDNIVLLRHCDHLRHKEETQRCFKVHPQGRQDCFGLASRHVSVTIFLNKLSPPRKISGASDEINGRLLLQTDSL